MGFVNRMDQSMANTGSQMFEGVLNVPLLQNKAGVRCAERTLDIATWNIDARDVCFEIFQWY